MPTPATQNTTHLLRARRTTETAEPIAEKAVVNPSASSIHRPTNTLRAPGSPVKLAAINGMRIDVNTETPRTTLSTAQLNALLTQVKHTSSERTVWHGIQTTFAYHNNHYVPTRLGVATWADFTALVTLALTQDKSTPFGEHLNFTLHDYLITDTGQPKTACLEQLQSLLATHSPRKTLEIVLRGDTLEPPRIITITAQGHQLHSVKSDAALTEKLENHTDVLTALSQETPHLQKLYSALALALTETLADQDSTSAHQQRVHLNEVLSRAIPHFNNQLTNHEQSYRVDEHTGRTKIVSFTQALARSCQRLALAQGSVISPFDRLLSQTKREAPGIYSIGGGQTLTLLLLAIQAMDRGKLPLDTRLEGDNRSTVHASTGHPINSAVAEIVEQNQRRTHLGRDLSIAQKGQCLIHMRPDVQRLERLSAHPPRWLLFNVPTNALHQVFTPKMLSALSAMPSAPIMVLSAKSFSDTDGKVDVPATSLYQSLEKTPNKLQNQLLVLGGYFAAPWLATGSPVHFVVAGRDSKAVDSFANLMPDDKDGPIKHDRRYGKDQLFGTAIMGALKNQAVYTFARQVLQKTYDQLEAFREWTVDQHCSSLNAWAEPAANQAIAKAERAVEQLTARHLSPKHEPQDSGALGLRQISGFTSAPGVRTDFERCMVRPIQDTFVRFVASLQQIQLLPAAEQGKKLRDLLANEVVDTGKGFGSRNSRDGVIDQALRIIFDAQTTKGQCANDDFDAFRSAWTPSAWLAKTTEGRNGMLPVLTHLARHRRDVPELIQEAAQYYGQINEQLITLANAPTQKTPKIVIPKQLSQNTGETLNIKP